MIFTNLIKTNLSSHRIGKQIEYYQQLDSTNVKAWELIDADEASHGTLVITDNQIKGKGRGKKSWFSSPSKGLVMSLILTEQIPTEKAGFIPLVAGISTIKALGNRSTFPLLKWPNDILIGGKKAGGILCESRWAEKKFRAIVVGIGINVNETKNDFPDEMKSFATSLAIETGHSLQRELVASTLINAFEEYWGKLHESPQEIIADWISVCGHINQKISFNYNNVKYDGIFKGIDNQGQAIVTIEGNDQMFSSIILD